MTEEMTPLRALRGALRRLDEDFAGDGRPPYLERQRQVGLALYDFATHYAPGQLSFNQVLDGMRDTDEGGFDLVDGSEIEQLVAAAAQEDADGRL